MKSIDFMRSSGQNLHRKLKNLLTELGVEDLKKIVSDSGSNVNKALEDYTRLNYSSNLFSNILDFATECTGELTEFITSCKKNC